MSWVYRPVVDDEVEEYVLQGRPDTRRRGPESGCHRSRDEEEYSAEVERVTIGRRSESIQGCRMRKYQIEWVSECFV